MKALALAVMVAMIAGQAAALSCMRPDPVRTFTQIAADDATYYVLYGTLDFDVEKLPQGVANTARTPDPITARFTGKGLSTTGFDTPFVRDVTVQPTCAGSWCGSAPAHTPSLIFAKVTGDAIIIEASPCGGFIFPEPSTAVLDAMTKCMSETCPSAQPLQ